MEQIFNLNIIDRDLDATEVDTDFEGNQVQRTFLGTVFALYPSGKFYTPWANSNVEVCSVCAKALDLPCDETDPCAPPEGRPDVAFSIDMVKNEDDTYGDSCIVKHKSGADPTIWIPVGIFEDIGKAQAYIREQNNAWHCEACSDAQWLEQASNELEQIGAVLASGEGDPCDLFAERVIETKH